MNADKAFTSYDKDVVAKARNTSIPGYDKEDVEQELRIILWEKLPRFDATRGFKERTFADRIMANRVRDLLKFSRRKKRLLDWHLESFEGLVEDDQERAIPMCSGEDFYLVDNFCSL